MVLTLWNKVKQGFFNHRSLPKAQGLGMTDIGKKRSKNEDAIFVSNELNLYLVADGMGGHAHGDIASALAVETISKYFASSPSRERVSLLTDAVREANHLIYTQSRNKKLHEGNSRAAPEDAKEGMGTTIVALAIDEEAALIAHVGDSRAYRFRAQVLERLTRDHSLAEGLSEDGSAPAQLHPRFSNIITRALGIDQEVEVEMRREKLITGDLILLCSDGLTHMISDHQIETILKNNETEASACKALIDAANDCGGKDNISCVLVRYN